MNFVTFSDLNRTICRNLHKFPSDIDLVVGIPRSGMLAASLVGLYLNVPITDIDSFAEGRIYSLGNTRKNAKWIRDIGEARTVLILDDSVSMGNAIANARQKVSGFAFSERLVFAAVYSLPTNRRLVDVALENCAQPRMFEWNYLHHWGLEHACMDIDGVLCQDPTFFQNDDGNRYLHFIENAVPRFLPTKKVRYLVTSRLEKYRGVTERWLKKYGVDYENLVMGNFDSAMERAAMGSHARFKGEFYKKTACMIFIESNYEQAVEICNVSGKQVFCTDRNLLITPSNYLKHLNILKNDWRIILKHGVRKILQSYF